MGSEGFSLFFFFAFSFFFVFLRIYFRFSPVLLGQEQTTAIYWENGEFHSDPVCTDPVQNFPKLSEALGPPQFQEKRSRSEKAILRALGAFRGILGAALGVQKIILGMRNPILGMASHDLCNAKTTILGATPGGIPGIDGNPHGKLSFAHAFSERFFKSWGGPRAPDN